MQFHPLVRSPKAQPFVEPQSVRTLLVRGQLQQVGAPGFRPGDGPGKHFLPDLLAPVVPMDAHRFDLRPNASPVGEVLDKG
jgi:hypothetical protein